MYAIARSGGKQFKIQSACLVRVPSLSGKVGDKVKLEEILLVADGDSVQVGKPLVDGAYAEATVVRHGKDAKIRIIKYKRRKDYHRTLGHRQDFTELEIGKIVLGAKKAAKKEAPAEEPVVEAAEAKPVVAETAAKPAPAAEEKAAEKKPAAKKAAARKTADEQPAEEKAAAEKKPAARKAAAKKDAEPKDDAPAADDTEKN
jgi:large subunit ribosomal protein L21